jgi:hypothetical protein
LVFIAVFAAGCATTPGGRVVELENKGTALGVPTPDWIKNYISKGISAVQAQAQYADKYCIIGEETGVNRQFVQQWADSFSAQQRIGALLRLNVASKYQATATGSAQSSGGAASALASGDYQQEIDSSISAVVNASYSGAQRESDWWLLRRRYDPDQKDLYTDEYSAYVMYTIPKEELNRQVASALETSVSKDSALYEITIALARDILQNGVGFLDPASGIPATVAAPAAAAVPTVAAPVAAAPAVAAPAASNTTQTIGEALEDISPEEEYYLGRAVAANILSTYKIWTGNPRLSAYVNRICAALVINSPRPELYNGYHVTILDSDEINAFATSGGHIFITRGLIACANSEDALAAVIAHEIAHIQLRHSVNAIKTSRITQAVINTGASVLGSVTGQDPEELTGIFNDSVGDIVAALINNGYSQAQEFDADNTALSLLAAAGYDPTELITMLRELEKTQSGYLSGFGKTHPAPALRIANAQLSLTKYPPSATQDSRRARFSELGS